MIQENRFLCYRLLYQKLLHGILNFRNCGVVFIVVAILIPIANANEESWSIEKLMHDLSEVKHTKLDFIEKKKSIFLIIDTIIEGTMEYRAPDYIEKNIFSPHLEKVVINGDSMVIQKTNEATGKSDEIVQTNSYSVKSHPLLKAAVESIRAMLAGNYDLLTENYFLNLKGEQAAWQLTLEPKSKEILEYIESIYLVGSGSKISEVLTTQADGDESKMTLSYQLLKH